MYLLHPVAERRSREVEIPGHLATWPADFPSARTSSTACDWYSAVNDLRTLLLLLDIPVSDSPVGCVGVSTKPDQPHAAYKAAVVAVGRHPGALQNFIHLPLHAKLIEVTATPSA